MEQNLPTGLGIVLPFGDESVRLAYMQVFSRAAGIKPAWMRNDTGVQRALYAPAQSRAILNVSTAEMLERLGNPQAIVTVEVEDTKAAANLAVEIFSEFLLGVRSLDAEEIEIGIVPNFMHFVLIPGEVPILFWPKHPDPELIAQMSSRVIWTEEL